MIKETTEKKSGLLLYLTYSDHLIISQTNKQDMAKSEEKTKQFRNTLALPSLLLLIEREFMCRLSILMHFLYLEANLVNAPQKHTNTGFEDIFLNTKILIRYQLALFITNVPCKTFIY